MAKDIQIKYINDTGEWEELFPATKARLVETESGQKLEAVLTTKANKSETYTKEEVNGLVEGLDEFDIPVQKEEPSEAKIWFETI